ncbi:putative T7SS-secreted protein [Streptomyces sp. NPDC085481]|uniref:putative T7SS-secreted protein n=1 Tax=Streptomyces sp. NPDC085481 TaxID=3365727 RepID=UPI0037D5F4E5
MVDWKGWGDKIVDGVDRGLDKGKELVGEGVDALTDKTGQVLDKAGAHDWADAVEDWGDETASSLGAEVGEQRLGQTEQADELVHGKPDEIAAAVKNLRDFQRAFDLVGGGMKKLDSEQWKGAAADAFRERFQTLPTDWLHAADAMENAAKALETYAHAVTSAQGKAREAIALYKEGDNDTKTADKTYREKTAAYEAARDSDSPLPHPGKFSDPGETKRKRAQEILDDARKTRNQAGETAKSAVRAALAHAPKEPTGLEKAKLELMDYGVGQGFELAHFGGGIVKGTAGLLNFVRSVNPVDPYNLTHPAEYYKGVNTTLAGLVSTVANPDRALKNAWDAAKGDPSEFLGRLVPELIGTKGAGGLKSLTRLKHLDDVPGGAKRPSRTAQTEDPHGAGRRPDEKCECGDPVDMATGRVTLPQTDVALPGALPLVLGRNYESSYRAGRWFGPSWASTIDQRLEIDVEGVLLLGEDGSLLAYPHPAPGVPVLPTHGTRRWRLDRDASDATYTVTDPETGTVRHFATVGDGGEALLVQIDDRNGNWITFGYDAQGAPTEIAHHGGYRLRLTTDGSRVTALHLGDQELRRYGYTDGHLTSVADSAGRRLCFGYDEHGRMTSWTDSNGHRYDYVYDARDRCVSQSGRDGVMAGRFTWGNGETTYTDALGRTTRFEVNDQARITAETAPDGATTRSTYDARGRLLSRTDPLGHATLFAYDEEGRLTAVTRPDGRTTTAEYDALGLPVRVRRPDGTTVHQTYDERGNRTSATSPSGTRTEFAYDDRGRLTTVTDPLGGVSRIRTDGVGLPVAVTDPLGGTTEYERDGFGRQVRVTDALGAETRLEWTPEGRLSRRVDPDGATESWTYDGEGNCLTHTDANGGTTIFTYGDFDVLASRTDPDGTHYSFAHDAALQLTGVTNPQGLTWTYAYDAAGRTVSETDFDGRTLTYAHDAAGRLESRTNGAGESVRFERNELGRLLRKDAGGAVTTYEYDIFDELAMAVSPDATLTRLRDRYGRLTSETVNGRTLAFSYDELGRRTGRTTPGGTTSSWQYDAAGRRTELTTSGRTMSFVYDASGRELTRTVGDFASLASTFDEVGRLTAHEVTSRGHRLQKREYHYRSDGYLIGIDDHLAGPRRFDLDAAGRVTAVRADRWTERYAYDEAGNQTDAGWPGGTEATGPRAYTGTRINRAGAVRYEHDAQGRTVLRQKTRLSRKPDTWRYTWDAEDRLTSVVTPDGTAWRYVYDPLGRRIAKHSPTETVHFTWDGTTLCEQSTETLTLTWDHAGLRPLAQTERRHDTDETRFFAIVTDLIGTPTELVDETGELAWRSRTTLWGTTSWTRSATAYTPLRFPGQYFDPESGLHYNCFRYYDPEPARYLSQDPLGLAPAPNPSTYVHNPHTWSDPLGLAPCPPKGEHSNPFDRREDAERAAFEAAGVPYGETPLAEWKVVGDERLKYEPGYIYAKDETHWGHFRQYETEQGSRVIVEHTHDPAGTHFHAGMPKNPSDRSFVNFGWDNARTVGSDGKHRYPESMERYLKINKEGGDHHFFYTGS